MITVSNITHRFGAVQILNHLSFKAQSGKITLLTGANGTGKSTALKIIAGVLREKSGQISLNGTSLSPKERHRSFAYLPQGVAFQPKLNARQLLSFYARIMGVEQERIEPSLLRWGLSEHAAKPSGTLSGGLRQRLGLAILSTFNAPAVLLDEPGLSLDPAWRRELQHWLREEADTGTTVIVATHLLAEWDNRADVCLVFEDGAVADFIDPNNLSSNPSRFQINRPASHKGKTVPRLHILS